MLSKIIDYSIRFRRAIIVLIVLGIGWSVYSISHSPLDAIPDISDPQIIIYTKWQRSAQILESEITSPLVRSLLGTKGIRSIRGMSYLGYSFVYVIMENNANVEKMRHKVIERINSVRHKLPRDADIEVGPEASSMGWIYQYALVDKDKTYDLRELLTLQENQIKIALESIPGVAEVANIGGLTKQYQLKIYPSLLAETGISLKKLVSVLKSTSHEIGGRILEVTNRDYQIKGSININNIDQIESMVVGYSKKGNPVQIRDIGYIQVGYDLRRGIADLNGDGEVVGGIIIAQKGENVVDLVRQINRKLKEIKKNIPTGIEIVSTYDRSTLIHKTLSTFFKTLVYEFLVVIVVMALFISHYRVVIAPVLVLILGILFTAIPLYLLGQTINLFSLAGLFLAMGEMADATIVVVENSVSELEKRDRVSDKEKRDIILKTMLKMGKPLFFSLLIIMISFLPIFFLEAQEGRLFDPLVYSKTFAMTFSTLLTFIFLPGLTFILLRTKGYGQVKGFNNILMRSYSFLLKIVLRYKYHVIIINFIIFIISIPLFWSIEKTFMPTFEEGSILYMPTTLPGLPAKEAGWVLQQMDKKLKAFPEVKTVFGKLGRADTSTDPAPFTMIETTILLKAKSKWRSGMTMEKLIKEMDQKMKIPGFVNAWTQPIRGRIDMQTTGIQTPVGIKVIGENIEQIEVLGRKIETLLKDFTGTRSIISERISDGYFIDVQFDMDKLAHLGIPADEALLYVQFALGGENVAWIRHKRSLIPLNIQYAVDYINTIEKIGRLMVIAPNGDVALLSKLAILKVKKLPEMVRHEDGFLTGYIYINLENEVSPITYVEKAKELLSAKLGLPDGYRLEWSGQFEYQLRAERRLFIIIPLVLLSIFILLVFTFKSFVEALLIMLSIPFALVGGVWLQWFLGYPMTIAVWIGYIALYAVAVQTGIIMIIFLRQSFKQKSMEGQIGPKEIEMATIDGAVLRLRPKLITVCTTILSLFPILLSSGSGMEIMKPIATPMVGGMITSSIHVLFLTPCLFAISKEIMVKRTK